MAKGAQGFGFIRPAHTHVDQTAALALQNVRQKGRAQGFAELGGEQKGGTDAGSEPQRQAVRARAGGQQTQKTGPGLFTHTRAGRPAGHLPGGKDAQRTAPP